MMAICWVNTDLVDRMEAAKSTCKEEYHLVMQTKKIVYGGRKGKGKGKGKGKRKGKGKGKGKGNGKGKPNKKCPPAGDFIEIVFKALEGFTYTYIYIYICIF